MCLQYCSLSTGGQQTLWDGVGSDNAAQRLLFYNPVSLCGYYPFLKFQFCIYCYEKNGNVIQTIIFHNFFQQVHEYFDFQVENELTIQDQISKERLFEDTFKFLFSNESSTSSFIEALQKIYESSVSKVVNSNFLLLLFENI